MAELEFEQKYILDPRQHEDIQRSIRQDDRRILVIRQFYDNGVRYRWSDDGREAICTKENKRSLKLNTQYSVSLEEEPERISLGEFKDKWAQSKQRLRKIRYEVAGIIDQTVMIDFFLPPGDNVPYAVVAEVEAMLTEDTKVLYLDLELPIYLRDFLLKTVDNRDTSAKTFKSKNMTEENIPEIERALEQLYADKPL